MIPEDVEDVWIAKGSCRTYLRRDQSEEGRRVDVVTEQKSENRGWVDICSKWVHCLAGGDFEQR